MPIHPHDIGLGRETIANVAHVADIDGRITDRLDGQLVQFVDGLRTPVDIDVILKKADLRSAGGQHQVLVADGVHHIHRREALRLKCRRVEIDLDLTLFSAVRKGYGGSLHGHQASADKVDAVIVDLLLGKRLSRKGKLNDGHTRGRVGDDQWRRGAGRQLLQLGL